METGERLEISNAVKLPFKVSSRDVYEFPYADEYSHIVLQDTNAVDTFPIILVGTGWTTEDKHSSNLLRLSGDFIGKQRNIIFIVKVSERLFRVYEYTKNDSDKLPLVAAEPVHSTAELLWTRSPQDEIISPEVSTLTGKTVHIVAKLGV